MSALHVPDQIATAAVSLLSPYFPGLTAEGLSEALTSPGSTFEADDLLTRDEVMGRLKISARTLDRMFAAKKLTRVVLHGRSVRVLESEVLKLIGRSAQGGGNG